MNSQTYRGAWQNGQFGEFEHAAHAWEAGRKKSVTDFRLTVNLWEIWTSNKPRETSLDLLTLALNTSK